MENSPKLGKAEAPGIHLPKISVASFDGNILNWTSYWEQFEITVHNKDILRDIEKLAYLRDAVKSTVAMLRMWLKDFHEWLEATRKQSNVSERVKIDRNWSTRCMFKPSYKHLQWRMGGVKSYIIYMTW